MKKWIHEKTGIVRYSDISEKTAKGHGFVPFSKPELKPVPKDEKPEPALEKPEPKEPEAKVEPTEPKPAPKKPRGRQRKKVD